MGKIKFHNGWIIGVNDAGERERLRCSVVESYSESLHDDYGRTRSSATVTIETASGAYTWQGTVEELDRYFGEVK